MNPRRIIVLALLATAFFGAAACSKEGGGPAANAAPEQQDSDVEPTEPTGESDVDEGDVASSDGGDFCTGLDDAGLYEATLGGDEVTVEEAVAQIAALQEIAPTEIQGDLELLGDLMESGAIGETVDEEQQAAVAQAIVHLNEWYDANCGGA